LENTSADSLAQELLEHCLAGSPFPECLLDELLETDHSRALFRIVVERLADLFDPRLCEVYADLFTEVNACGGRESSTAILPRFETYLYYRASRWAPT
jgi:hypothetical protein